ncbi:ATP-grasp domain-containing protein [Methanolobus chelungpuianus]|uniref:ATP-grasp domain-containing protein n=1 Tax=Methanolobus chelungpuianus TaxID=502115 RepID=UPI002115879A|nr:ATP-grasp domain-containing protein [Methanolobus chelungpuianus]
MKKIMILGAAKTQVPIIKLAKERRFEVIVVSCSGDYPGLKYADKICEIDITDKEKVLEAAAKEQVDGIVTDQLDFPVPTIAYVTEKLGLPGIGYDCALKFTNKYLMRNECTKLGIKNPEYYRVSTLDEAREKCLDIGLPVIIKPTDSAGSRGIYVIRNINELEDKFNHSIAFSKEDCLIVEKYIEGPEYVIAGFASNYKFTNLAIGKRQLFDIPDIFIPSKTLFTSVAENDIEEQLFRTNKALIEGFGLKFGVTHCEYIVEEATGDIYLVECAARGAAICISSHLIPLATGIDVNSLLLDVAVGNAEEIDVQNIESDVSGYLLFTLPKGFVKEIRGFEKIRSISGVQKVYIDPLFVGMETKVMTDKGQRLGPILIKGKTKEECENTISEIKALFEIDVETSEGVKGIIW